MLFCVFSRYMCFLPFLSCLENCSPAIRSMACSGCDNISRRSQGFLTGRHSGIFIANDLVVWGSSSVLWEISHSRSKYFSTCIFQCLKCRIFIYLRGLLNAVVIPHCRKRRKNRTDMISRVSHFLFSSVLLSYCAFGKKHSLQMKFAC